MDQQPLFEIFPFLYACLISDILVFSLENTLNPKHNSIELGTFHMMH